MRARVRVGVTRRRSSGPTRSGLIENSSDGWLPSATLQLSPGASCSSFSGSMVIVSVSTVGRGGDRRGDDLALRLQALHARVDQAGAELVEIEEAGEQRDQPAEIEHDDAARQRRGKPRLRRARQRAAARADAPRGRAGARLRDAGGLRAPRSAPRALVAGPRSRLAARPALRLP